MYKIYPYNNLYRTHEEMLVDSLLSTLGGREIYPVIKKIFDKTATDRSFINTLMRAFPIGTPRGNLLMTIAESILRIPDNNKKNELIAQLKIPLPTALVRICAEFLIVQLSTTLIAGKTIEDGQNNTLSSYDMLGEAAVTTNQANTYFKRYLHAAETVVAPSEISIKLSSLHPRYEYLKQNECLPIIIHRVQTLLDTCNQRGIELTIDAEETDRLDLSMMVVDELDGRFSVAVQAYQKRALGVLKYLNSLNKNIGVRLVKGAYWDTEIKMAQERGLHYPVFTSKENTNISFLACAKFIIDAENISPKFATHNPSTIGAILALTDNKLEFQQLYGMGNKVHELVKKMGHTSRIYKPIGTDKELLAYLIRRMMENGANTSFLMHNRIEDHVNKGTILNSYQKIYNRNNSSGLDLSDPVVIKQYDR